MYISKHMYIDIYIYIYEWSISLNTQAIIRYVWAFFVRFRCIWEILASNRDNSQPAEAWHRSNYSAYNWAQVQYDMRIFLHYK